MFIQLFVVLCCFWVFVNVVAILFYGIKNANMYVRIEFLFYLYPLCVNKNSVQIVVCILFESKARSIACMRSVRLIEAVGGNRGGLPAEWAR